MFKQDITNRYMTEDYDGAQLYLDLRISTAGESPALLIYQGHSHHAINDKLESLDVSNELTIEEVDELICKLMDISKKMEAYKNGRE